MGNQVLNLTFTQNGNNISAGVTNSIRSNVLSPQDYGTIGMSTLTLLGTVDAVNPSSGTFTASSTTDLLTKSAHGYKTGLIVQVSNSGGALPTNLSAATPYYVIYASANTFYLATSLANALNAVNIDLGSDGSGTNTVTPTALASASISMQGSMDGANWVTIPNQTKDITVDASFVLTEQYPQPFIYFSAYVALDSGQLSFSPLQFAYGGQ